MQSLIIFSDGCATQYKNNKNLASLIYFKKNFGLDVEWHFSASYHGKGAVDGIGATIKRNARLDSIRNNQDRARITNARELHTWAEKRMKNVKTFLVTADTVKGFRVRFDAMVHRLTEIKGMRSMHSFIPNRKNEIDCGFISESIKTSYTVCPRPLVFSDLPQ